MCLACELKFAESKLLYKIKPTCSNMYSFAFTFLLTFTFIDISNIIDPSSSMPHLLIGDFGT